MRQILPIHDNWQFSRDWRSRWWLGSLIGTGGLEVSLPHCWNARDSFTAGVKYYRGYGSYRKRFAMPGGSRDDESTWLLVSDGFYGTGDVWLNGRKVANVDGQYLGFSLDVGERLRFEGDNAIGIRLTNRCSRHVLPGIRMPDFVLYGGLAGKIRLERRPLLHIADDVFVSTAGIADRMPVATVRFNIVNNSPRERLCRIECTITGELEREEWKIKIGATLIRENETRQFECAVPMTAARLWSTKTPVLHTAALSISDDGGTVDCIRRRFGVRDAQFRADAGFFLNGERIELRGVNRHESMPEAGNALPPEQHRKDAVLIRDAGLNFVRLSHYPQHPLFLDACDELGILVYAEIATWKSVRTGRWLDSALRQTREMIVRDRNHPSVILWGMGNESRSRKAYMALREEIWRVDQNRPTIYAENHLYRAKREKTLGIPDVWGCNYELDELAVGRDASRLRCVVVSECSNYPHTVRGDTAAELEQVRIIERDLAKFRDRQYVAGFALWCFNDYGTLRKGRFIRYSGIFDGRREPKLAAALLKAMFSDEPVLELRIEYTPDARILHVFSNCEEVILSDSSGEMCRLKGAPHMVYRLPACTAAIAAKGRFHGAEIFCTEG